MTAKNPCGACNMPTPIDSNKKPIVWVLGGPGVGKGTQCDKIIAKYGFTHLSTGDLLRDEAMGTTVRAKCLAGIMERGELVPNVLVLQLLKEKILERAQTTRGFLIDGYPREKDQGIAFEKTIAPCTGILYFEASPETLTKRLLGRAAFAAPRIDDTETSIDLRIKNFLDHNEKVLAQYRHVLNKINAERPVDAIFADVQKTLDPIVERAQLLTLVTKLFVQKH